MTTETTERWDATWSDTGEHPAVNVTSAVPLDGPIYTAEDAHRLAIDNARLSKQVRHLTDLVERLTEDKRAAHLDQARLQAELDRRGWLPTPEQMRDTDQRDIRGADDLTEREYNAGLYRPADLDEVDDDGMPYTPIGSSSTWPTWLGGLHHADATLAEHIGGLRSWADTYVARPVERTVVEPVQVDYSYRQSDAALYAQMVVSAAEEHVASVYDELAPERIHADVPPDNRVDRMVEDPERYFAEARERAERQVQAEMEAGGPPHRLPPPPPPPAETAHRAGVLAPLAQQPAPERRGRLRRMWDAIRTWDGTGA